MNEDTTILPLDQECEKIRCEINSMIPGEPGEPKQGKAKRLAANTKDAIMYGGEELATKVSGLIKAMNIGKVCYFYRAFFLTHKYVVDMDLSAISQDERDCKRLFSNVPCSAF